MADINLNISVEPVGDDRFTIQITKAGVVIKTIPEKDGLTEIDLRAVDGLPKCGLTKSQIDKAIVLANSKRQKVR
jgi:hypothetical protein